MPHIGPGERPKFALLTSQNFVSLFPIFALPWNVLLPDYCIEVGEAKRILTDETARRRYDQTGSTSDRPAPQEYFRGGGFSGGPHDGPTAEDIFEAFFGNQGTRSRRGPGRPFFFDTDSGPFFQGGPTFHQYPHQHQQERQFYTRRASPQSSASFMTPLFGLVAFLILLFVLNFVANRATPGPVFSLRKSQEHSVPHYTKEGLKYWLSPGYYDSSTLLSNSHQRTMDNNVYNAWLRFREQECSQDLSQARRGAQPARPKSCAQYDELRNLKNSREW